MSWTLYESVSFDDTRITSIDWQTYPILRFDAVPDSIDVHIINRPGQPFLGSGETGQGPAAASIANAITNATGVFDFLIMALSLLVIASGAKQSRKQRRKTGLLRRFAPRNDGAGDIR